MRTSGNRAATAHVDHDPARGEFLMHALYARLHMVAERLLRAERRGIALQPSDLIHEAWLRLAGLALSRFRPRRPVANQ